jgi:hypothetical protein
LIQVLESQTFRVDIVFQSSLGLAEIDR